MSMCSQMNASLNLTMNNIEVKNACTSMALSKRYIKDLIRIAVLNILYRRIPLSEDEFKSKEFEDVPFVVFKRKAKNPILRKYHGWAAALIDAIDKNYLKELHLMFKEKEDITEYYKFTIKYSDTQNNVVDKFGELKDETKYFFTMLKNLEKHPKLGKENQPIVEFTYYDDTPENYEPPYFGPSSSSYCLRMIGDFKTLAKIHTGYQSLAMRATGETFKNRALSVSSAGVSHVSNKTNNDIDLEQNKSLLSISPIKSSKRSYKKNETNNNDILKEPKNKLLNVSGITIQDDSRYGLSDVSSDFASTIQVLDCICKTQYEDMMIDTARCKPCGRNFHLPCLGFLDKFCLLTPTFHCHECKTENYANDKCLQLKAEDMILMGKLRLFLSLLYKDGTPENFLNNLETKDREAIKRRMLDWGIYYTNDDLTQSLTINKKLLDEIVPKLLKTNDSLVLC